MKLRPGYFLLIVSLFSLLSCSKEVSKEIGGHTVNNGDFYATINGKLWNADSAQQVLVNAEGVSINGLSKTGEQISIILPVFKTGTYTLNSTSVSYALYANMLDDVSNVFVSNTGQAGGSVTITAIDTVNHLLSGTFQFNLTNPADNTTKTITQGVFDYVLYMGDGGPIQPPVGGGSDTLNALIDGNIFNAAQIQSTIPPVQGGAPSQLIISGISGDASKDITLMMPAAVGAGTYNLDFADGQFIGIYYPLGLGSTEVLISDSNGSLTIISNDTVAKRIKGTFSFNATPFMSGTPANITQGYFAVNY